ncbi:Metalloprotease TIKI2 [Acropora cervicornis]|uniref:Metalloprotease TIKI homolog n=1 Tax=Acropora cervicornis TaxID=6130 RepID=A0AAD9US39_ACRCE|nr:Metalloprotease TIKI2 [Acropora cervicornis]
MNSNSSSARDLEIQRTREIDAYFRTELIVKRNERMAKRVIELLNKYPERNFFFAFGAGHFIGNHSIIDIMRREGFTVDHLGPKDQLPNVNTSALKEEDASTNHKQAALQLSSAVKMDERQIAIATLFSLLLWSLMKNVI